MNRQVRGRSLNGLLLVDKSAHVSSNGVVQRAKRLLQANKVGHTGSLDPMATGLLPLCLGEATKLTGYLLDADKRYDVTVRLGVTTTTGDAEGDVLETKSVPTLSDTFLNETLARFLGPQLQVPPMYSALKYQGRRLYELAREGHMIDRAARSIHIHALTLMAWGADTLALSVHCSKGTYVRSLAEDIGVALGSGAHVTQLRRTVTGIFDLEGAVTLEKMRDLDEAERLALLMPMDRIVPQLPALCVEDQPAFCLQRGQTVPLPEAVAEGVCRLYHRDRFIGIGEVVGGVTVAPKRMFNLDHRE